jgi:hypothetical protein
MTEHDNLSKDLARGTGRLLSHLVAVVVGVVLMISGVALGVTIVALPLGIPVGLVGLFVFLWGLFGWSQQTKAAAQPPEPR